MSTDDPRDDPFDDEDERDEDAPEADGRDVRERIEQEADRAVEQFDQGIVELLSWVLDTETRARIYAQLRTEPHSTSDEVAEGTGLYPSTVREALADLHDEGKVTRTKRESDGAGNNPYEYAAIAPSDLVSDVVDDVQSELNTVFNLDDYLDRRIDETETDSEPVTINVEDEADEGAGDDADDWGSADEGVGDEADGESPDLADDEADADDESEVGASDDADGEDAA